MLDLAGVFVAIAFIAYVVGARVIAWFAIEIGKILIVVCFASSRVPNIREWLLITS